jgi:hypothetical protein
MVFSVRDSALHGPLAAGAFSFIADYSGDTNYLGSTSDVEPLSVEQEITGQHGTLTFVTVIVDAGGVPVTAPVPVGTSVRDTATISGQVSGLPATGTVTYKFFTTIDGTGPHTDEVVTLNPDGTVPDSALHGPLAAGPYSFIAVYSGDSNYEGSISAVEPLTVQQGTSVAPPSVVLLQRFGYHEHPTAFVLTFSSDLDVMRAEDLHNYTLRSVGPLGHLGQRIPIVAAVYNPLANTVTLHPAHLVYLFQRRKLVVNGMPPAGVAGPSGILLDGRGNGIPGSDYVRIFGPSILAGRHPRFVERTSHEVRHVRSDHTQSRTGDRRLRARASAAPSDQPYPAPATAGLGPLTADAVDAALGLKISPYGRRWSG